MRVHRAEDDVWRQAHCRGRHGVPVRQRERGRAGPDRPRRGHHRRAGPEAAWHRSANARVSIAVRRTALALRPLGRRELKRHTDWNDGQPATELNFKFYRQATNKIIGISDRAAAFLDSYF
jgi:hypothetical protein